MDLVSQVQCSGHELERAPTKVHRSRLGQANLSATHKDQLGLGLALVRVSGEVDVGVQGKPVHLWKH